MRTIPDHLSGDALTTDIAERMDHLRGGAPRPMEIAVGCGGVSSPRNIRDTAAELGVLALSAITERDEARATLARISALLDDAKVPAVDDVVERLTLLIEHDREVTADLMALGGL